eukprot:SAG22_NODE_5060_length_1097_cov_2.717435_1_plen_233_part_01
MNNETNNQSSSLSRAGSGQLGGAFCSHSSLSRGGSRQLGGASCSARSMCSVASADDVHALARLLTRDAAVLAARQAAGEPLLDEAAADKTYEFPREIYERLPCLRLYAGETVGVGGGGRGSGDAERYAVLCSLSALTLALETHRATEAGDHSAAAAAHAAFVAAQKRGPKLLGQQAAARPLSLPEFVGWGAGVLARAGGWGSGGLAAAYVCLACHDLMKIEKLVAPLRLEHPG